jgi:hypothetical protein
MVREQFNQEITRQLVEQYDPTRVAGRRLTKGLREHFYKAREAFRRDIDAIPISSMAFRPVQLEKFQRCLARRSKNDISTNTWSRSTPLPYPREHLNLIAFDGNTSASPPIASSWLAGRRNDERCQVDHARRHSHTDAG